MTILLPTLIYEPDEQNRVHILSLLSSCAEKCNGQFPVLLSTGRMGQAMKCVSDQSEIILVIVGVVDMKKAGRQIFALESLSTERNRDNYILYWIHLQ